MDGGIEFLQAGECHSPYVKVNGTVEELYCIFHQSLVLGVTHMGGIDRTAVMFGKSGEIIIADRLVAFAPCDGGLQIVGDDSRRNAFKILYPGSKASNSILLAEGSRCRNSVQPDNSSNCPSDRERSCPMPLPLERNKRTYLRAVLRAV